MHQKKENLEYILREITNDFFVRKKPFSKGDWERYYFAKYCLNQIYINEQNGSGLAEKILVYLLEKIDNSKNRKRMKKTCQSSADIYESFFKQLDKIPDYKLGKQIIFELQKALKTHYPLYLCEWDS